MAYTTLNSLLTAIAEAIRSKKGTTAQINAQNFPSEIESISASLDRDAVNISKGSSNYNLVIINQKKFNSKLLFTNNSSVGDATNVNNGNFGLQYSENGTDWVDYPITANTITYVKSGSDYYDKVKSPSGATVSVFRWQYNKNNNAEWYTNESHKYWRYYFTFKNNNHSSYYFVEQYIPTTTTNINK